MKMTETEYEELILRFKWLAEKVEPCYTNEVENLVEQYEKEYKQYVIKW